MPRADFPQEIRLSPTDPMDTAGRHILLYWLGRMCHHEQILLQRWDTDVLHDMRVATRRMRVACRIFEKTLNKKKLSPFSKRLKSLGRVLGAVRDLDVLLSFVAMYAQAHGETPGLNALQDHMEEIREAARKDLIRHLNKKKHKKFSRDFSGWLLSKPKKRKKKAGGMTISQGVPSILATVRDEILACNALITDDTPVETLHQLRIVCKKLRYTADSFSTCYGEQLAPIIELASSIQDTLGRYHDADVHIAYLHDFISRLNRRSARQRRIQSDLEAVIASEQQMHAECLTRFHADWPQALDQITRAELNLFYQPDLTGTSQSAGTSHL